MKYLLAIRSSGGWGQAVLLEFTSKEEREAIIDSLKPDTEFATSILQEKKLDLESKIVLGEILSWVESNFLDTVLDILDISDEAYLEAKQNFNALEV